MNLHLDPDAFEAIILQIADKAKIRNDILEKDYYVTLILKELSEKQDQFKAYFKGGTALYKALNSIKRFSEDIDLTVSTEGCESFNQIKNRVEKSTKKYTSLTRLKDDPDDNSSRNSITTVYGYTSLFNDNSEDPLHRFGRVKIEATSFTISEPIEALEVASVIYTLANEDQQAILRNQFKVSPFNILTIKLERIFIDKIFATEFYFQRYKQDNENKDNYGFDVAKHVFDLMTLHQNSIIKYFQSDYSNIQTFINYKRIEEEARHGGIDKNILIKDFAYLSELLIDSEFAIHYQRMQDIYVFQEEDKILLSDAKSVFNFIKTLDY